MENWHEIIRCILFKENIDQKELALRLGCSRPYVSRIFTGKDKPSKKISKLLLEIHSGGVDQVNESKPKGATHYSKTKDKFFKYNADSDKWHVFKGKWYLFKSIKYVTDLQEI